MVQNRIPSRQGDYLPLTREPSWHPVDRSFHDPSQDARFATPIHTRALSIEAALRDCASLPVKEFALIVQLETGEEKTYTSQSLTPWQPRIFGDRFRQDFRCSLNRVATDAGYVGSSYQEQGSIFPEFDTEDSRKFSISGGSSSGGRSRQTYYRQARSDDSDGTDSGNGKRKRVRGTQYSSFENDDTPVPIPVVKANQITIGNDAQVEEFYVTRFKDMQQSSCKVMGKAFVKLVEPKKQTHHPYTKGNEKAPPWWPRTTGDNHVRHREPDHLLRPERIRLLVHIIGMITEPPDRQCEAVRKSNLNVQKLEDATMEAMNGWFGQTDNPGNLLKRPFLKEIFKVAKIQERYKSGEIDHDTRIPVLYGDRSEVEFSDDETEEDVKDEDEETETNQIPANMPTPDSMVSQPMMQTLPLQQSHNSQENDFMAPTRPLSLRYATSLLDEQPSYNHSSFLPRAVSIGVGFQPQSPSTQESSRRSFGSPVYPSSQGMYGWQNATMATNGSLNSPYYTASQQAPLGAQSTSYQLPPPPTTQQPMLPPMTQNHFDGLSNGRQFDSGPAIGSIVRTGSLGHPHHMPAGFQSYLHTNGYGHDSDARDEHLHHN